VAEPGLAGPSVRVPVATQSSSHGIHQDLLACFRQLPTEGVECGD